MRGGGILAIAGATGLFFYFRQDLASFYSSFFLKLPQLERGISDLVQEAGKQMRKTLPDLEKEWLAEVAKFDASAVQYQLQ